jgi:hypothetical protein
LTRSIGLEDVGPLILQSVSLALWNLDYSKNIRIFIVILRLGKNEKAAYIFIRIP